MEQKEDVLQDRGEVETLPDVQEPVPDEDHQDETVSPDIVAELRFEFLQHISTMALLAAGGAITLLRTVFAEVNGKDGAFIAIGLLVASAITALTAQQYLVERLGEQTASGGTEYLLPKLLPRTRKLERIFQTVAVGLLGTGIGLFAGFALVSW